MAGNINITVNDWCVRHYQCHFSGTTVTMAGTAVKGSSDYRDVFRRLQKTDSDGADVTHRGRLFQVRAAATGPS